MLPHFSVYPYMPPTITPSAYSSFYPNHAISTTLTQSTLADKLVLRVVSVFARAAVVARITQTGVVRVAVVSLELVTARASEVFLWRKTKQYVLT